MAGSDERFPADRETFLPFSIFPLPKSWLVSQAGMLVFRLRFCLFFPFCPILVARVFRQNKLRACCSRCVTLAGSID